MSAYCRAYLAEELRRFPEWSERVPPLVVRADGGTPEEPAQEFACFFVHDDLVVTAGVLRDEQVVFDRVDDAWRTFCRETLEFKRPDDSQA